MSQDEHLRQITQDNQRNHPFGQKVTESDVSNAHDRNVINNEIDRIKQQQDEERRRQGQY